MAVDLTFGILVGFLAVAVLAAIVAVALTIAAQRSVPGKVASRPPPEDQWIEEPPRHPDWDETSDQQYIIYDASGERTTDPSHEWDETHPWPDAEDRRRRIERDRRL